MNTSFPVNRTSASITDQPETLIVNQTTIPAIQSTIKVNQTIDPLQGQTQILQPLQNQSILPETPNLSAIDNATIVKPTGPTITTIANKTIVSFNQTLIETENITNSYPPQQQQQNQSTQSQQPPQQQQQQQNQSQGPLNQLGETVGNLIPRLIDIPIYNWRISFFNILIFF